MREPWIDEADSFSVARDAAEVSWINPRLRPGEVRPAPSLQPATESDTRLTRVTTTRERQAEQDEGAGGEEHPQGSAVEGSGGSQGDRTAWPPGPRRTAW